MAVMILRGVSHLSPFLLHDENGGADANAESLTGHHLPDHWRLNF